MKVFVFVLFGLLVLSTTKITHAMQIENPLVPYIDSGEGYGVNPGDPTPTKSPAQQATERQKNNIAEMLNELFNGERTSIITIIPTPTVGGIQPSLNPSSNPTTSVSTQPQVSRSPNKFNIMYRQDDYPGVSMPDGCDIAFAGCGPSAVANVVANLKDTSATPETIVTKHYGLRLGALRYASCKGTTYIGHEAALKAEGFITEIAYQGDPVKIDEIADELIPFLKNGSWIVAGGNFSGGGHFFVITDIIPNGNSYDIIGLDSDYGNRNTIPINYRYMYPYPYIKNAVAAKL